MSKSLQRLTMEQNGVPGGQYETGNATDVTGSWFAIQAIESTTINGGTTCNIDNISGCVVPAGSTIFGEFSVVKCSGKAILYND
jgi:hypothetical protein